MKVCTFWMYITDPLCPVHYSFPTREPGPWRDAESKTYGRSSWLIAALGKPEESLNFWYWTCGTVGLAPCYFDRRLHTGSCCKRAKTFYFYPYFSRYQLTSVSNKYNWRLFIFTGYMVLLKWNCVLLGVIFLFQLSPVCGSIYASVFFFTCYWD